MSTKMKKKTKRGVNAHSPFRHRRRYSNRMKPVKQHRKLLQRELCVCLLHLRVLCVLVRLGGQ